MRACVRPPHTINRRADLVVVVVVRLQALQTEFDTAVETLDTEFSSERAAVTTVHNRDRAELMAVMSEMEATFAKRGTHACSHASHVRASVHGISHTLSLLGVQSTKPTQSSRTCATRSRARTRTVRPTLARVSAHSTHAPVRAQSTTCCACTSRRRSRSSSGTLRTYVRAVRGSPSLAHRHTRQAHTQYMRTNEQRQESFKMMMMKDEDINRTIRGT